jgi:hypothetical protein
MRERIVFCEAYTAGPAEGRASLRLLGNALKHPSAFGYGADWAGGCVAKYSSRLARNSVTPR